MIVGPPTCCKYRSGGSQDLPSSHAHPNWHRTSTRGTCLKTTDTSEGSEGSIRKYQALGPKYIPITCGSWDLHIWALGLVGAPLLAESMSLEVAQATSAPSPRPKRELEDRAAVYEMYGKWYRKMHGIKS